MEKHDMAIQQFMDGYRCSQAVLSVYASEFGIDKGLANKISISLAGGSGVGGECGAVSGAYLVIGLKYGFSHPGGHDEFGFVMGKTQYFLERFKSIHGEINCPELIGLDVFSETGYQEFVENNIKQNVCTGFVRSAIEILEEMITD